MRLLFLIPELGYGGAEGALLRLTAELAKRYSVTIAVFSRNYRTGGYAAPFISTTVPVLELDSSGQPLPGWVPTFLRRWLRRVREISRLKTQSDVCISFLPGANLLNVLTRNGLPSIISERGSKMRDPNRTFLDRLLWRIAIDPFTYYFADRIVSVSQSLTCEILQVLPYTQRAKVLTISGYLNASQALVASDLPIDSRLNLLIYRPVLVSAGRLHSVKGLQHLLPLFSQVVSNVPDACLLIVGDGPQLDDLVTSCSRLGLSVSINKDGDKLDLASQVIFLGYQPNPARYMKLGRAFVMPSLSEGLPNILLEAMAVGTWCLAADCGGTADILSSPDLGCLLPSIELPSSHKHWVAALKDALLHHPPRQLSLDTREQLVARFSIQRSAQRWENLLKDLVG